MCDLEGGWGKHPPRETDKGRKVCGEKISLKAIINYNAQVLEVRSGRNEQNIQSLRLEKYGVNLKFKGQPVTLKHVTLRINKFLIIRKIKKHSKIRRQQKIKVIAESLIQKQRNPFQLLFIHFITFIFQFLVELEVTKGQKWPWNYFAWKMILLFSK